MSQWLEAVPVNWLEMTKEMGTTGGISGGQEGTGETKGESEALGGEERN